MTKQELYDLSIKYRNNWSQLRDSVKPLLDSPITGFSLLVDYSAHKLECPKADQVYKLYKLTRPDHTELNQLKHIRTLLDSWIRDLESVN